MQKIIPAILEKSYERVCEQIETFKVLGNDLSMQIDICDGVYVDSLTWLPDTALNDEGEFVEDLKYWESINYEADLMLQDTLKYIEICSELGFSKVVVHIKENESIEKIKEYYEYCKNISIEMGISSKDINRVIENVHVCDYVQIMGIRNIGKQRQDFDEDRVVSDISKLKEFLDKNNIKKIIQIDGSMNEDTIKICFDAGASQFVVGSALKNAENLVSTYKNLRMIV